MNKKDLLKGLTPEQIERVKSCKNQDELLKLAKEEGVELNEEQLKIVNGGMCTSTKGPTCPHCKSSNTVSNDRYGSKNWPSGEYEWYCKDCRKYFN